MKIFLYLVFFYVFKYEGLKVERIVSVLNSEEIYIVLVFGDKCYRNINDYIQNNVFYYFWELLCNKCFRMYNRVVIFNGLQFRFIENRKFYRNLMCLLEIELLIVCYRNLIVQNRKSCSLDNYEIKSIFICVIFFMISEFILLKYRLYVSFLFKFNDYKDYND